ncbi:TIP-1 family-domain-containing protein, partial [Geopyxis carbonaria]
MATATTAPPDPRVQDYLNDKFQALRDLDSLDSLLTSVQTQQTQLRTQLTAATTAAATSRSNLSTHTQTLQAAASAFEQAQLSIDRRLQAVGGEAGRDAEIAFGDVMEKVRRVEVAEGYVALLQRVGALEKKAREGVEKGDPQSALAPYAELRELAAGLRAKNDAAEGAAVHLTSYVDGAVAALWGEMKARLSKGLEDVLAKIGWPAEEVVMEAGVQAEFAAAFDKLLVLQRGATMREAEPLLAFEVLVKPLAQRFRYHFEGERPTNRIDKPEWFLAHLSALVGTHAAFLATHVQPLLPDACDAITEFTTALLPCVRRKIAHVLPQITGDAPLLSHFVHSLLKFDAELRETYGYTPTAGVAWRGLTHEVLVTQDQFPVWLASELAFAQARYTAITTAPDAWDLDADTGTRSALRLKDLLETTTDSYRPLISFSQRLRFLITIQLHLLDSYHARLSASVDAFAMLSSGIARAVSGTTAAAPDTPDAVRRLCKVHGSALFLEAAMRDWGEDVFFLELWEDLSTRAAKSSTVAGTPVASVAAATSAALTEHSGDGALFDETAAAYAALRLRTEELLTQTLATALKGVLKPYTALTAPGPLDLGAFAAELQFLRGTLPTGAYRRVVRPLGAVAAGVVEPWLKRGQWTAEAAQGVARDVEEVVAVLDVGGVGIGLERVREAVRVLGLMGGQGGGKMEEGQLGLKEVVKDVFEDNEKARAMLARLGVEELTVADVRALLGRRVDAW